MENILNRFIFNKTSSISSKANRLDDVVEIKSEIMAGYYVNDKEVETKIDRFIYRSGKVLTKVYRHNHLCMIQMVKA